MARQDLYILKRGETAIGLEGFVIVLDQYVLLLSLEYAESSYHYLIGSTLSKTCKVQLACGKKTDPLPPSYMHTASSV